MHTESGMHVWRSVSALTLVLASVTLGVPLLALRQGPWMLEAPAIRYRETTPDDAVAALQRRIDDGKLELTAEPGTGYLRSVLRALRVPESSQMLVFSKTSAKRALISPQKPRAIYFNDSAYVSWVPGDPEVEVSTVDPRLGVVFYTRAQAPHARFERRTRECLTCHVSALTEMFPGHLMRSVYADEGGAIDTDAESYITTDASPFRERWGGWYVTGRSGAQYHMGNQVMRDDARLDLKAGSNVTSLAGRVDTAPYPAPGSDLVALMVLAHQTHVQNLIIQADYRTRLLVEGGSDAESGSAGVVTHDPASDKAKIAAACEPLVRGLLFADEAPLTAPVSCTSSFARDFERRRPRDRRGRSLYTLDLKRRLMRYPCSYVIYSSGFDGLPRAARDYVYRRLSAVLNGDDRRAGFDRLTTAERAAIRQILIDTKPGFAEWLRRKSTSVIPQR